MLLNFSIFLLMQSLSLVGSIASYIFSPCIELVNLLLIMKFLLLLFNDRSYTKALIWESSRLVSIPSEVSSRLSLSLSLITYWKEDLYSVAKSPETGKRLDKRNQGEILSVFTSFLAQTMIFFYSRLQGS